MKGRTACGGERERGMERFEAVEVKTWGRREANMSDAVKMRAGRRGYGG